MSKTYEQVLELIDKGCFPLFDNLKEASKPDAARKISSSLWLGSYREKMDASLFKHFVNNLTSGKDYKFSDEVAFKICMETSPYEVLKTLAENNFEIAEGVTLSISEEVEALKDFKGVYAQAAEVIFKGESAFAKKVQGLDNYEQLAVFRTLCKEIDNRTNLGGVPNSIETSEDTVFDWLQSKEQISFMAHCIDLALEDNWFMEQDAYAVIYDILEAVCSQVSELYDDPEVYNTLKDIENGFKNFTEVVEDFQEFIVDEFEVEDPSINLNLLLQFNNESNSDFSNIEVMNSILLGNDDVNQKVLEQNALTWLIYQQGYTLRDLATNTDSDFLKSVRDELQNMSGCMNVLTVLCNTSTEDIEAAGLKPGAETKQPLKFEKDVTIGLFDPWQGGGSLLEITLEKPLIIPGEMVFKIQVENARKKGYGYTVNEVFGMSEQSWDTCLEIAKDEQPLLKIDIKDDVECLEGYRETLAQQPD